MADQGDKPAPTPSPSHSAAWGFFSEIRVLLSAFKNATTGQKSAIVAMSIVAGMFLWLGRSSDAIPSWTVLIMFALAALLIFATAWKLVSLERSVVQRCVEIPTYPPSQETRDRVREGLEEIRKDAVQQLQAHVRGLQDDRIRANIFMLAQIAGGPADGTWKLVIHPDWGINMNHVPELGLQFAIGQGATGVAYRDGSYQFTRRQQAPEGHWEQRFQMTPALSEQVHKNLKWILSFPLLIPDTNTAVGVLNIDGLVEVTDDDLLQSTAGKLKSKVDVIAKHLALQPSQCVAYDALGVIDS